MNTKTPVASLPDFPQTAPESSLPPPTDHSCALAAAGTCRETIRLLRRMLARLPWRQLTFSERARLAREVRRLMADLTLALLILETGKSRASGAARRSV